MFRYANPHDIQVWPSDSVVQLGVVASILRFVRELAALGWIVHRRAQRAGRMAPKDEEAYREFHAGRGLSKSYPPFSPFIYSLENCAPFLVKLGQDDRWGPDPDPQPRVSPPATCKFWRLVDWLVDLLPDWAVTPRKLRCYRWLMIIVGWVLATFFVAGLTGIIKTK